MKNEQPYFGKDPRLKQSGRLTELIEKGEASYNNLELRRIYKMFPELENKNPDDLFIINSERLSLFEVTLLRISFPNRTALEIKNLLQDKEAFGAYVSEASKGNSSQKEKLWQLLTVLPLEPDLKVYAVEQLKVGEESESLEPAKMETEEQIANNSSVLVNLPVGYLPHFETYLASSPQKDFSLPKAAVILKNKVANTYQVIELSEHETAAVFAYAKKRLEHIKDNRTDLEARYKKEQQLSSDVVVNRDTLRDFYFKKYTKKRIEELMLDKGALSPVDIEAGYFKAELRFRQLKKGVPKEIRSLIASSHKLQEYFAAKAQGQKDIVNQEPAGFSVSPEMIPLSVSLDYLEGIDWQPLEVSEEKRPKEYATRGKGPSKKTEENFNELQRSFLEITHATKNGDWPKAVEIYLRYLDYWPQYLEHRLGVLDIYNKVEQGVLDRLPAKILSIASGPHEELRAQHDIAQQKDFLLPDVVSVDFCLEMLKQSRKQLPPEIASRGKDIVADMRELPLKAEFDVVECSSFDNLKNEWEVKLMIVDSYKLLRQGGVFRFMLNQPFSEDFCQFLAANGFAILEKNKAPGISPETKQRIIEEQGKDVLRRIEHKLKRHCYFLARKDEEFDADKFATDLEKVSSIFAALPKELPPVQLNADSETDLEEKINEEQFDYNVQLTVALNPMHFLEKKNLPLEYLRQAILSLKGKLDHANSVRLYKTYFGEPDLSGFCDAVFETVAEDQRMKNYFSLFLLGHENQRVRDLFSEYLKNNFAGFALPFLESEMSMEEKTDFLRGVPYDDKTLAVFSKYIAENIQEPAKFISFLQLLPETVELKLDLPLSWRFNDNLQGYYNRFSRDFQPGAYSFREITKFLASPLKEIPPVDFMAEILNYISREPMSGGMISMFNFLMQNSQEQRIVDFINQHKQGIIDLAEIFRNSAGIEPGLLLKLQKFEKEALGVEQKPEDAQKLTEHILVNRYKAVYDKYLTQRKRIENEKEAFLAEVKKAIEDSAKDAGLPYEIFLYAYLMAEQHGSYVIIIPRSLRNRPLRELVGKSNNVYFTFEPLNNTAIDTPKGRQMTFLVNEFLEQEREQERKKVLIYISNLPDGDIEIILAKIPQNSNAAVLLKKRQENLHRSVIQKEEERRRQEQIKQMNECLKAEPFNNDLFWNFIKGNMAGYLISHPLLTDAVVKEIEAAQKNSSYEILDRLLFSDTLFDSKGEELLHNPQISAKIMEAIDRKDFNPLTLGAICTCPSIYLYSRVAENYSFKTEAVIALFHHFLLMGRNSKFFKEASAIFGDNDLNIFSLPAIKEQVIAAAHSGNFDFSPKLECLMIENNPELLSLPLVLSKLDSELAKILSKAEPGNLFNIFGGRFYEFVSKITKNLWPLLSKEMVERGNPTLARLLLCFYIVFEDSLEVEYSLLEKAVNLIKNQERDLVNWIIDLEVHEIIRPWGDGYLKGLNFLDNCRLNSFTPYEISPQFSREGYQSGWSVVPAKKSKPQESHDFSVFVPMSLARVVGYSWSEEQIKERTVLKLVSDRKKNGVIGQLITSP